MRVATLQGIFIFIISYVRSNVGSEIENAANLEIEKIPPSNRRSFVFRALLASAFTAIPPPTCRITPCFVSLAACSYPFEVGNYEAKIDLTLKHLLFTEFVDKAINNVILETTTPVTSGTSCGLRYKSA